MEDIKKIENMISKLLDSDVKSINLISQTSNLVFKVDTEKYGIVYAKYYLNKSSHIDHELDLYDLIDNKYLKELIIKSDDCRLAIYKELKGKTLDELTVDEVNKYKEKIVDSLIYFYETIGKEKISNYGLLDCDMNGTSENFIDFIVNRQKDTEKVLEEYPILNNAFSSIYAKYRSLMVGDNSLVPIDTNAKNIMVTEDEQIKFIDPGELISGPKLMGYGDFVAHTYKTELYDCLVKKLNLNKEDMQRLRIYAVFSSLNILAFLKKAGVNDLEEIIPYGNSYAFCSLINDHLSKLGLDPKEKQLKR